VIVATGTPTGPPAKAATTTIPIVFVTGSDPVEQGSSLISPTRKATSRRHHVSRAVGAKRLELLRELVPSLSVVGVSHQSERSKSPERHARRTGGGA